MKTLINLKLSLSLLCLLLFLFLLPSRSLAVVPSPPNPQRGSIGLEGTVSGPPPQQAATITTPANGSTFTTLPVTVSGLCSSDLLVKVFTNNVFVGSVVCSNGSYQVQVDLFSGRNDLVARVYDALDQTGPDSNTVSVTFNDLQFLGANNRVTISSFYARRGANPGQALDWPINLAGGTPPYALAVDWGDGSNSDLYSLPLAGDTSVKHTYTSAGIYVVIMRASDAKGTTAYLQLVGVANGATQSGTGAKSGNSVLQTKTIVIWWPALIVVPFILATFWLGRRSELHAIRARLERDRRQ